MKHLYLCFFLFLCTEQLFAQNKGMIPVGKQLPAGTERRLALVIGNGNYLVEPLKNPHNDADDMAKVLQNLGFDVILEKDLSMIDFLKAIDDFGIKLRQYNVGLLYYSGHGIQYQGENYLVPIDAKANAAEDIEYTCVKLGRAMTKMEGAELKVSLAFLDACRNNPFPSSSKSLGQCLTIPNNPPGSFLAFSTRVGSTPDDNNSRENSLFTTVLLQNLPLTNVGLKTMMYNVIKTVVQGSSNSQIPVRYDELKDDFYFTPLTNDNIIKDHLHKGEIAFEQNDFTQAFELLYPYREHILFMATHQRQLGYMYSEGHGVKQDYTEAVKWFRKAAEQGHAFGQNNLGYMYENGIGGLNKDLPTAIDLYQKSARQGNDYAQKALTRLGKSW